MQNAAKVGDIQSEISQAFGTEKAAIKAKLHKVEHHTAHLASTFFVSPFDQAVVVSVDGFGDSVGAMWGSGKGNSIEIAHRTLFPHSLGLFYLAVTQFLGFPKYGDEYKVMGLAAFGEPTEMENMRRVVRLDSKGDFRLVLEYFIHHSEGVTMAWNGGAPMMGPVFSSELDVLLGPNRQPEDPIDAHHHNIAASL